MLNSTDNATFDALETLVSQQDRQIDSLAQVLAELVRRLRPDLALLYSDHDEPMVADLLNEHGPDGLVEELVGLDLTTFLN